MKSIGSLSAYDNSIKVLEAIKENIIVADADLNIVWINPRGVELFNSIISHFDLEQVEDLIGEKLSDFHRNVAFQTETMKKDLTDIYEARVSIKDYYISDIVISPIREDDVIIGYVVMLMDVTTTVQEEKRKNMLIQELSAPLLHVWDKTYAIPLLGLVDTVRFEIILEKLLKHCGNREVDYILIDFSEIREWNQEIHINHMITALSLMGVQSIIVGLKPELAKKLSIDIANVKVFRTSNLAIKYIISQQKG